MRRRDLLVGAAALGVTGFGGAVAFGHLDRHDDAIDPVELETIDAPGSDAGTVTVPDLGRVTFLELFATWCDVCERTMPSKAAVYDDVGSRDDLQFLSVTNEPIGNTVTREDVADWWGAHDGAWTVAMDDDLDLTEALDAAGVPAVFVFDEDNHVVWSDRGETSETELRDALEGQLTADDS